MHRTLLVVSALAGVLMTCASMPAFATHSPQNGPYVTLGLGYEPHDYFSRISRQGNPASVIRVGACETVICLEYEHHSSAILGGAQSERETDMFGLLFRYEIGRFRFELGPAVDRNQRMGGQFAAIGRIRYHLLSHYFFDYEHIKGRDAHINLFGIVGTWHPFSSAH